MPCTRFLPRLRWRLRLLGVCLLAAGVISCRPVLAEPALAAAEGTVQVEIGFGGVLQVGRWTPVRVAAPSGQDATAASVTVADVDGRPVAYPLQGQGDSFSGSFQSGRVDASIHVSVTLADGQELETTAPVGGERGLTCLRQETDLWLLVGRQIGFERAAETLNARTAETTGRPAVHVVHVNPQELPTDPLALDGVQLLVLGAEPITPEQSQCLRGWIEGGGRLVLVVGSRVAEYRRGPLAEWLPLTVGDPFPERQTTALTGAITAFVPNQGVLRSLDEIEVAPLGLGTGAALIDGPSAPVVVRTAYGLGLLTVVALNLDERPFVLPDPAAPQDRPATWGGLPQMCLQLAGAAVATAESLTAERELQLNPTGISDLYSQLAGILDHFPGVERASNWNVIGLLLVYLLVVGPLDYLVVHKILKKPHWTWATLPLWVLLASWWATALAASSNGSTRLTRQIEVLDVAAETRTMRVTGWLSVYSPETRRHTVEFGPRGVSPAIDTEPHLAPLGRPEEGFRGMYRRGGINLGGAGYEVSQSSSGAVVQLAPVEQWSSLAVAGSAVWSDGADGPPLGECRLVNDDRGHALRMELTHRLPGELTDWFAVEQLQATFPLTVSPEFETLVPGRTYNLLDGCGQKLLRSYVQGEITQEEVLKTGSTFYTRSDTYDPLSLDSGRLFRVLSFHEAIGGASFTHLGNHALERYDFSPVIQFNRLVVCGRLSRPVSRFSVDGEPVEPAAEETFVRLLIPIVRTIVPAAPESPQP